MSEQPLTVLVVDDDFRVAALHVAFVERLAGFEVVGRAQTAAEAVSLTASLEPDLVLLDIYLPDGDGIDVIRSVVALPSPPAVLVVSAANDVDTVQQAVQLGAVHYLVKPFGFAALADRLVAFQQARRQLERWPREAQQNDVDLLFRTLRSGPGNPVSARPGAGTLHFAPTTQRVYEAVASSDSRVSASEVAEAVGISRATAQRCLAQLERSAVLELELQYGHAGRPEHRYSVKVKS